MPSADDDEPSSSILIAFDAEPGTAVEVTNPGGAASGEAVVEH